MVETCPDSRKEASVPFLASTSHTCSIFSTMPGEPPTVLSSRENDNCRLTSRAMWISIFSEKKSCLCLMLTACNLLVHSKLLLDSIRARHCILALWSTLPLMLMALHDLQDRSSMKLLLLHTCKKRNSLIFVVRGQRVNHTAKADCAGLALCEEQVHSSSLSF